MLSGISAGVANLGIVAAGVFNIQGMPYSAGFGMSGLVGQLNYINLAGS